MILYVGCGIVKNLDFDSEVVEIVVKFLLMMNVLGVDNNDEL